MLEIDCGGAGARIIGTDNFNGAAVPGAVLFDHYDAVIRLFAGAYTRQTDHNHGEQVPFEIQSIAADCSESDPAGPRTRHNNGRTREPGRTCGNNQVSPKAGGGGKLRKI